MPAVLTKSQHEILSLAKLRGMWDAAQANGLEGDELSARFTEMWDALRAGDFVKANELADAMMGEHKPVAQKFVTEMMTAAGVEVSW